MKTDWETLYRARDGDRNSWEKLWRLYQPRMKALAYLITGSTAEAEDIAEETLFRAMNAGIRNSNGTVKGFLGTIAYRLALKENKRRERNEAAGEFEPHDNGNMPLESIIKNEREKILAESIRGLSDEHREVLVLKFYAELPYEAIADMLKIPIGTARSRVFYAVKSCRENMREKGLI